MLWQNLYEYILSLLDQIQVELIRLNVRQYSQVKDIRFDKILEEMAAKRQFRHHACCFKGHLRQGCDVINF